MATKIDYHFSITPNSCNDGKTIPYFLSKGFNTAQLVVWDQTMPVNALNTLKAAGLNVIVDIEQPIWAGGQQKDTPIQNFAEYFKMLRAIGVNYVASEGGRDGDLDFFKTYFNGYVNYNCDQCGLWKGFHKHPSTVMNSWECYYPSEWPYIQNGIKESQGKKQGILAGVWTANNEILSNTRNNVGLTYYTIADWIDANAEGGLDHFHVWAGLNEAMLDQYKALGFEPIVGNMQAKFPPKKTGEIVTTETEQGSNPAICAVGNQLYLFVQGTDHVLYYQHYDGTVWSDWKKISGILTSGVDATATEDGVVHVAVRGTDKAVWHLAFKDGVGNWDSRGGQVF